MKKCLKIMLLISAIFLGLLMLNNVEAAEATYQKLSNGKYKVTLTYSKDLADFTENLTEKGWTVSGKTASKDCNEGDCGAMSILFSSSEQDEVALYAVPINAEVGTIINMKDGSNYSVEDDTIATVSGVKITTKKAGSTTISGKKELTLNKMGYGDTVEETKTYDFQWDLTVTGSDDPTPSGKWTDFSNAKITLDPGSTFSLLEGSITGVTPIADHGYRIYVSKNATESGISKADAKSSIHSGEDGIEINFDLSDRRLILEEAGDKYAHILEFYYDSESRENVEKVVASIKLDVPSVDEIAPLGSRIDPWLYIKDETDFTNKIGMSEDRTITYKLGKVNSNDVLRAFKENPSKGFSSLLDYAKNADILVEGTVGANKNLDYNILKDVNLGYNEYCFMYLIASTNDGKYREIEDVQIYRGLSDGTAVHFAYGSIDIPDDEQNNEEGNNDSGNSSNSGSEQQDEKKPSKLPKTGEGLIVFAVIGGLIFAAIFAKHKINKKYNF